jgi:hypothetical protein
MTYQERRTTVVRDIDPTYDPATGAIVERRFVTAAPSGGSLAERLVVLVFGIAQLLIVLRIILLLIGARTGNQIVSAILDLSQVLVAPFEGILRTDALHAAGGVLDVSAIVALIGWSIVELVVLAVIRAFRTRATA